MIFLIPLLNQKKDNINYPKINEENFYFKEIIFSSIKNKNYILLNLGYFTCGFHVTFIALHLPNDLVSKGLSLELAGWALALIGLFNVIGALIAAWLGNKVPKKNSLAFIYLGRSLVITFFILTPTYNDWRSLNKLLSQIDKHIAGVKGNFNVIVINDASNEACSLNVKKLKHISNIKILNLKKKCG